MHYHIDPEILKKTEKCGNNFSCLNGAENCLCEVDHMVDGKLLFIKPRNKINCDYKTSFGYSYYCNCPTRKEIYKLFKI